MPTTDEIVSVIDEVLAEYEKSNPYNRKDIRFPSKAETRLRKLRKELMEIKDLRGTGYKKLSEFEATRDDGGIGSALG